MDHSEAKAERNDMPVGFSMSLAQDRVAMSHFALLGKEQQEELMDYIREAPSEAAKERIIDVVHKLHNRMIG